MKVLVAIALVFAVGGAHAHDTTVVLFNFAGQSGSSVNNWKTSSGATFKISNDSSGRRAVFTSTGSGTSAYVNQNLGDLRGYTGFEVMSRVTGKQNTFKIQLRHKGLNSAGDSYYEASFKPPSTVSGAVWVPFSSFVEKGKLTNAALDTSRITQFGFRRDESGTSTLEIYQVSY